MTALHCCRMPYLMNQFGMVIFDALYLRLENINVIQIILDFVPDAAVERNHIKLMNELTGDIVIYLYDVLRRYYQWIHASVDAAAWIIDNNFGIVPSIASRMVKNAHMVIIERGTLTVDDKCIRRLR